MKWTYASLVVMLVVSTFFLPTLAQLFNSLLMPLETILSSPTNSVFLKAVFDALLPVYRFIKPLLTEVRGLALLLAISLILAGYRVVRG